MSPHMFCPALACDPMYEYGLILFVLSTFVTLSHLSNAFVYSLRGGLSVVRHRYFWSLTSWF